MASASRKSVRNCSPSRGAATRMPGMMERIERSQTPLWLAPSEPVIPARSRTRVSGSRSNATSMSNWSKARLRKVEYTATTGCTPPSARPAAEVMACCSAMPTSKKRSGNSAPNLSRPVGPAMAAVIATMSLRSRPALSSSLENTEVQPGCASNTGFPVTGSIMPVECIRSASSFSAGA